MAKFKLKNPDYYLNMGTPPCSHCECTQSIKLGLKPCPYLDSPFLTKVVKTKFNSNIKEWVSTSPYTFIDFTLHYILSNTFERIEDDNISYEIYLM